LIRLQVRAAHADLQLSGPLVHAAKVAPVPARKPFAWHEIGVHHGHRLWEGALQSRHVSQHGVAVGRRSEALRKQPSALSELNRRLCQIDTFDLAVELVPYPRELP